MSKRILLLFSSVLFIVIIFAVSGCQEEPVVPETPQNDVTAFEKPSFESSGPEFVPGELLVKFKEGTSDAKRTAAVNKISGIVSEKILTRVMQAMGEKEGWYLIKSSKTTQQAVNSMRFSEDVEYAEPNYLYYHFANSNDPLYTNGSLWGMYGNLTSPANQYGSQAGEKYPVAVGSNPVYIGVIDEGIMYSHEDLNGQVRGNPVEVSNGADDDKNGYVDDVYGWDFDKNDNTVYDGTSDDHATHVAGTIGAIGNNSKGVAGVCWNVKMISVKFLGRRGGTTANAIKAVDYITDLKVNRGLNVIATNNSWGGGGYSTGLYQAIERAKNAGILFIAAAGNDGSNNDAVNRYPAGYTNTNIIAVASITSSGGLSYFSNYGASTVDIGAPGSGIYSSIPGAKNTSKYASYSGTSMATPHVTGAAALYYMNHSGSTAAQIKTAILNDALPTGSLSGKCVSGGRLDVSNF